MAQTFGFMLYVLGLGVGLAICVLDSITGQLEEDDSDTIRQLDGDKWSVPLRTTGHEYRQEKNSFPLGPPNSICRPWTRYESHLNGTVTCQRCEQLSVSPGALLDADCYTAARQNQGGIVFGPACVSRLSETNSTHTWSWFAKQAPSCVLLNARKSVLSYCKNIVAFPP